MGPAVMVVLNLCRPCTTIMPAACDSDSVRDCQWRSQSFCNLSSLNPGAAACGWSWQRRLSGLKFGPLTRP